MFRTIAGALSVALVLAACAEDAERPAAEVETGPPPATAAADCADPAIRDLVQRFGARLREVSLLAPDTVVSSEMRDAYAALVTPELLAAWIADPATAPGRDVSSPWPQRIDVAGVAPAEAATCLVSGEVVYVTSADTLGVAAATRARVTLTVANGDGWRIHAYEAGEATPSDTAGIDTAGL